MGLIDEYGYNPHSLLISPGKVSERLRAILGDKVMRFDPYSVDDVTLLACVWRASWQPLLVNGKPVTNPCMVESLQNKIYFVSHALMCTGHNSR